MPCAPLSMFVSLGGTAVVAVVPPGLPSIDNGAHVTGKLVLKTQVSEDFAE